MELKIEITQEDIGNVKRIVAENQNRIFVQKRIERNITGAIPDLSQEQVWLTMSMCLLTTQQRSNPDSPISRFLLETPFRLSLSKLENIEDVRLFAKNEIKNFGGIRFGDRISKQIKYNFDTLKNGGWIKLKTHIIKLLEQRRRSPEPLQYRTEREAAYFMNRTFKGFGPKQSRNFWQSLGLMRYEFVLDSRVIKVLKKLEFPIPLNPMSLGDEGFYCFLSDVLRSLCLQADILPCILDAAIFSSFDNQEWPEDAAIW